MKKYFLFTVLIAGLSILFSFKSENYVNTVQDNQDKEFVNAAAEGGMLEVKLGELAVKRGNSQKIKDYGNTMITEHAKVNEELTALAKKKKIELPKKLGKMKQQAYDSLAAEKGEKFDMLYMNMMLSSHEETIGLFQTETTSGKDADLKKWADAKIPALKHHLEMAKMLFDKN